MMCDGVRLRKQAIQGIQFKRSKINEEKINTKDSLSNSWGLRSCTGMGPKYPEIALSKQGVGTS